MAAAAILAAGTALFAACGSTADSPVAAPPAAASPDTAPGIPAALPAATFRVASPAMADGEPLPAQFTCDGAATTPPLSWSGAPAGTAAYAVAMHHTAAPDDVHWYWVVYNLPATVDHLDPNAPPPGKVGTNSVNRKTEYTPPCSKGPGDKLYTVSVYALSRELSLPNPSAVSWPVLLAAMDGSVLAEATLSVTYARPAGAGAAGSPPRPAPAGGPSTPGGTTP